MSDDIGRNEKDEKDEKGDEEWGGEKWSGEKWSADPLGRITWALIIIWVGVVFLLRNLGEDGEAFLGLNWDNIWAWILAGAGVLLWLEVLVRLAIPSYRRPVGGRLIFGTILVILGIGGVIDVSLWPLILVAIGVAMLLGYFTSPRRF
jgi:hypothetical protein